MLLQGSGEASWGNRCCGKAASCSFQNGPSYITLTASVTSPHEANQVTFIIERAGGNLLKDSVGHILHSNTALQVVSMTAKGTLGASYFF